MKKRLENFSGLILNYPIVIMLIVYFIIASIFIPYFFGQRNIYNILLQSADLIIISIGLMFVFLNGGIDFSIIAVMGLGSVVGVSIMNTESGLMAGNPYGVVISIIVMLLIGLIIGCINGLAVVFLKMPSFMVTMANYLIFSGLALFISNSNSISGLPEEFLFIGSGKLFDFFPFPVFLAVVLALIIHIILSKSAYGRSIYAVGTSHAVSNISGIPVKKIIFSLFLISGLFAAIGGIVTTSRLGASRPLLNDERMMNFVAAIILGGTSVFGGKGDVKGVLIGALFISIINNSLSLLGLQWYTIMLIVGAFLLFGAWIDAFKQLNKGGIRG